MRVSPSGPHFGGCPNCLHDFRFTSSLSLCQVRVARNAIWALRGVGDRNGDELLGFWVERPGGKYLLTKCVPGFMRFGSEFAAPAGNRGRWLWKKRFVRHEYSLDPSSALLSV